MTVVRDEAPATTRIGSLLLHSRFGASAIACDPEEADPQPDYSDLIERRLGSMREYLARMVERGSVDRDELHEDEAFPMSWVSDQLSLSPTSMRVLWLLIAHELSAGSPRDRGHSRLIMTRRQLSGLRWLLPLALAVGCEEPQPPIEFGSFDLVKNAALKLGCVEWRNDRTTSVHFECTRIVGPSCTCGVRLILSGDARGSRTGLMTLEVENSYCPRSSGTAIAYDLLAAAVPTSNRDAVADYIAAPRAGGSRDRISRFRKFGDLHVYVHWTPVRHTLGSQDVDPEKSDLMTISLMASGFGARVDELTIVPDYSAHSPYAPGAGYSCRGRVPRESAPAEWGFRDSPTDEGSDSDP